MKGRALTWFAGKRLLGHGTPLGLRGLPPGTRLVRLVVRDRFGRKATATVRVRMRVVRRASASSRSRHGRCRGGRSASVLQLSATAPATLVVGKQRFAVGLRTRRVTIRLKPGKTPRLLRLVLVRSGVRTAEARADPAGRRAPHALPRRRARRGRTAGARAVTSRRPRSTPPTRCRSDVAVGDDRPRHPGRRHRQPGLERRLRRRGASATARSASPPRSSRPGPVRTAPSPSRSATPRSAA